MRVLDLGCWPGSWMQYVAEKVGDEGLVYGIDLRPVSLSFPANVQHAIADVFTWTPAELGPDVRFDLVLSDMAPHTTGDSHTDKWRSEALAARALEIARQALRPGGHLVAKVFQGGQFPELLGRRRAGRRGAGLRRTKWAQPGVRRAARRSDRSRSLLCLALCRRYPSR
jgi:23S rRNA (uridine2552-2'-O)-methyltransferase